MVMLGGGRCKLGSGATLLALPSLQPTAAPRMSAVPACGALDACWPAYEPVEAPHECLLP